MLAFGLECPQLICRRAFGPRGGFDRANRASLTPARPNRRRSAMDGLSAEGDTRRGSASGVCWLARDPGPSEVRMGRSGRIQQQTSAAPSVMRLQVAAPRLPGTNPSQLIDAEMSGSDFCFLLDWDAEPRLLEKSWCCSLFVKRPPRWTWGSAPRTNNTAKESRAVSLRRGYCDEQITQSASRLRHLHISEHQVLWICIH